MLIPHFDVKHYAAAGAASAATVGSMLALLAAFCNAGTVIQTTAADAKRDHLVDRILFFAGDSTGWRGDAALSLAHPTGPLELLMLVAIGVCGGIGAHSPHPKLSPCRPPRWWRRSTTRRCCGRCCSATRVFGESPSALVYVGATIVRLRRGLFVIWRERALGLQRAREAGEQRGPEFRARPKSRYGFRIRSCSINQAMNALKVMMV